MNRAVTTLDDFFAFNEAPIDKLTEMTRGPEFDAVKKEISKQVQGLPIPKSFFQQLMRHVNELLELDIWTILSEAWSRAEALQKYADKKAYPPDESSLLWLAEHTIVSEHTPSLKPSLNRIELGEIKFKVKLSLTLKGAILRIQNSRIMDCTLASCEAHGSLACGKTTLLKKATEPLTLPVVFDFVDGIPIGGNGGQKAKNVKSKKARR
ncbi:MAG: hypothetical protein ACE5IY_23315 [bacterium]